MTANFLNSIPLLLVRSPARALTYALMMLAGLLTVVVQTQASAQGTTVSGIISATTTWTTAASPYRISADLSVAPGVTLTMQPGVTIVFNAGVNFTINGGVIAKVAAGQPIIFTSAKDLAGQTPAPGDWGQIRIINGSNILSDFDGVEFRYGSGLVISGASPLLNRIAIRNMAGPAITVDLAASPRGVDISASGNTLNGVSVPAGDISGNITWAITGIPYVLQSGILGVGESASISSISPNVFLIGQTADATIFGGGLSGIESLAIDRPGVAITARPGASATSIPITVVVPANTVSGAAIITAVAGAGTASVPVSIAINLPPTITLSAPVTGAEYTSPATIGLAATATATNPSATITKVEFLRDGVLIPGDVSLNTMTGVYAQTASNIAAGTYVLTARATDSLNISTLSAPVTVTVFAAPTVTVLTPITGLRASTSLPLTVSASATANIAGVSITKVEFVSNLGAVFGTVTTGVNGVYTSVWTNIPGGANGFVARATDSRGGVATSAQLNFTGISEPDVVMTAPANNASFAAVPTTIALSANASSVWANQGISIARVEFYEGINLLGAATSGTNSIYSISWNATRSGTFGISAIATDSVGGKRTSAPIAVTFAAAKPTLPYALVGILKGDATSSSVPLLQTQNAAAVGVIRGDPTLSNITVPGGLVSRPVGIVRGDPTSPVAGSTAMVVSPVVGITK